MKVELGLEEAVKRELEEAREGNDVNVIKINYVHVWKCHNEIHYYI